MTPQDSLRTATLGLKHSKTRSFLTMLGIVIGIASVILLMSIGNSAERLILKQVEDIGSNLVFVIPGGSGGSRFSSPASAQGIIIKTLVERDANNLEREPSISRVAPEVRGQAKAISDRDDVTVNYSGTTANYFEVRNFEIDRGRFFTESDVQSFNRGAVLGSEIAKTLFGNLDPVGKTFRLKNISFRVLGVLKSAGIGPGGVDQDNNILVPITVAQKQLLGINYYNMITIQTNDDYTVDFAKSRIASVLRANHRITDPDKDDFTVRSQEDALDLLGSITSILTVFLTSIAFVSLVVGGIGIMNIMLVSVIERTKEIGLRKAVGATNKDILTQFLWEAILLTVLGGAIGILFGAGLAYATAIVLNQGIIDGWSFTLPMKAIIMAVSMALGTGLVFGIYPAKQAAKKTPIDALRYE